MTTTSKNPVKTKTTKTAAVKSAAAKTKTAPAAKKSAAAAKTKTVAKVAKTSPAVAASVEVAAVAEEIQVSTTPTPKPVAKARVRKAPVAGVTTSGRMLRKTRMGQVISDKMDKTVVVAVERLVRHPLYGRILKRTTKLKAHDQENECRIGDKVKLMETRPLSRDKRWRVVSIIEKAK